MGFLSGSLLAVSLLNFCCLPLTTSTSTVRTNAFEGDDVLLQLSSKPVSSGCFTWYKGKGENKHRALAYLTLNEEARIRIPAYGRVTINYDGSLLIKDVTKNDAGIYTIVNHCIDSRKQIELKRLKVYEPVRVPTLLGSQSPVKENEDVMVFTCYTGEASIRWFFNGMILQPTERIKLSKNHRTLTIDPIKREDAGYYQCAVSHPVRLIYSGHVDLYVKID